METLVKIDLGQKLSCGDAVIIELGCGQKKKQGRIGIDTVDLQNDFGPANGAGARVDLNAGVVEWLNLQNGIEHLVSNENVTGTSGDDILIGDEVNNQLHGGG